MGKRRKKTPDEAASGAEDDPVVDIAEADAVGCRTRRWREKEYPCRNYVRLKICAPSEGICGDDDAEVGGVYTRFNEESRFRYDAVVIPMDTELPQGQVVPPVAPVAPSGSCLRTFLPEEACGTAEVRVFKNAASGATMQEGDDESAPHGVVGCRAPSRELGVRGLSWGEPVLPLSQPGLYRYAIRDGPLQEAG